jgi:hypothetical protein
MNAATETFSHDGQMPLTTRKSQSGPTEAASIPEEIVSELRRMRRDPAEYKLSGRVQCGLGCGKGAGYHLTHPKSTNAGTWCAVHGWLFLDSGNLPPTEGRP